MYKEMIKPLITIIIPTYNYSHLISQTLQSVVDQSYTNWECIIVDDGSTDETSIVVNNFLKRHSNLNFQYVQITNSGTSVAKNTGIALAKGEFIQFLDADDLLSRKKLQIQTSQLLLNDCDLVFSVSKFFTDVEGEITLLQKYPDGYLAKESLRDHYLLRRLVNNNQITISSPLVKADLLRKVGGFNVTLRNNEDWLLWFTIANYTPFFLFDNDPESYVMIRVHKNSAMTQQQRMFEGEVVVRTIMDLHLHGDLKRFNLDLLALHHIRSVSVKSGFTYIISNFINAPVQFLNLFIKGLYKVMIRIVKLQ